MLWQTFFSHGVKFVAYNIETLSKHLPALKIAVAVLVNLSISNSRCLYSS